MGKYYKCEVCGNVFEVIEDSGVTPMCCGEDMKEMDEPDFESNASCRSCSMR